MLQPACTMLWKSWIFYPVLTFDNSHNSKPTFDNSHKSITANLGFMLIFVWNFVIKAHIPNVLTFLIIVVGNSCIVLILWQIYSNLLGRRVVEVVVGEGLAQCGVVVEWEEWDAHLPTCEMAEETMTGGQDCLLHPAWGMATMTVMTVAMITTHRVVDHHQSCHHVTGDLSVLSVPILKLFIYKWHVWLTFNPKEGLTCLTGNQKDDRTQTWCVPRMSVDPSLMLAEVLTNARQCHQCPLLIVALTMVVHASPQTSIAEEHPHLRQVT